MVQIQLGGEDLLPQDGKVQLRKLILVGGMFSYFTVRRKRFILFAYNKCNLDKFRLATSASDFFIELAAH